MTKTLIDIEQRGILEGTCITAYGKYPRLRAAFTFSRRHPWLRAGQVMQGIYLISMVMWAGWCSYDLVVPVLIGEVVIMCRVVRVDAARG